jgi:hypothetical protein
MIGTTTRERPARPCPTCGKMSMAATYPFCSKRCADVDLYRWLNGAYAIPVVEADDGSEFEPDRDR